MTDAPGTHANQPADERLHLSVDEVLASTRTVRKRLDFDRPVARSLVVECLGLAVQAPNGSNGQPWHWVVVDDDARKQAVADVYRRNFGAHRSTVDAADEPSISASARRVLDSVTYLAANLHRAPVLVLPCIEGRLEGLAHNSAAAKWGSVLPAAWSFMLAARERGLGSAWTTVHLGNGGEEKVAEILGIPFADVTQAGLFPVAYTIGTDFRPAPRRSLNDVLHWGAW